ncbi:peptidoglycan DD-metalloendopeptidase family protein [Sphingobacterium deserti]|uniref:Peptidase M23 n=1 Tax=Sphingobacterium deserti TaxID=1229276 RepID=A0A0B8T370_9SPHI|nr:peptidoglycan DD-metalloendopeptidase family protein [Sphingobacterium deserti]KGE15501.1 peptidase M23 [Sphingobacterium deserti]
MNAKLFLSLVTFLLIARVESGMAQEGAVALASKRNSDKSVEITYQKLDPGTFTVALTFKELQNAEAAKTEYTLRGYSGQLTTLTPSNKDQSISYSYTYRFIRGKLNPRVNEEITYALPYEAGTLMSIREASFLKASYFGNSTPDDWKSYVMTTTSQQTVVASRKGIVVEVNNKFEDAGQEGSSYTSERNDVTVEHEDGSIASYAGFAKNSIAVKVGTEVLPGTVLGKNVKRDTDRFGIYFMVMYLKSADFNMNKGKNMATTKSFYGFLTPKFWVNNQPETLSDKSQYDAEIPNEVITQEMSKKELKRYNKSN